MLHINKILIFTLSIGLSSFTYAITDNKDEAAGLLPSGQKPISQILKENEQKIQQEKKPQEQTTKPTPKKNKSAIQNQDLNPGLNPATVGETPSDDTIPITTKSKDPKTGFGATNHNSGFSIYNYLKNLKKCTPIFIQAGADIIDIKGYKRGRCHVIYIIAGRKVNCMFTAKQLKQLTSSEKMEQAKSFDRGVGMILRPLGTDDPKSPLYSCQQ